MNQTLFTGLSTDVVMFTIRHARLLVLLVRRTATPFAGSWALPGGWVPADEDLDACAVRVLREKAGVSGVYLEQLYSFGRPDRDPRGRVVSVSYFAVLPVDVDAGLLDANRGAKGNASEETQAGERAWVPVDALPPLAFDHTAIIHMAHQRLASKLAYSTIALQFMPVKFTLSQLQTVYEIILGERLDKRNFRKRVQAFSAIEETDECFRAGNHRPAKLFRVKSRATVDIIK